MCDIFDVVRANDLWTLRKMIHKNPSIVNIKNSTGDTPLLIACTLGLNDCSEILLLNNAYKNARNNFKETALIVACRYNHVECIQLLLLHCAELNAVSFDGTTALDWAVINNSECLHLLKYAGGRALSLDRNQVFNNEEF